MALEKQKKLLNILPLSGAIGVAFYTAYVVLGGFLLHGYSHVRQTISELTATGAPNADFLRVLTAVYGFLLVVFSICAYIIFKRNNERKASIFGALFLIISNRKITPRTREKSRQKNLTANKTAYYQGRISSTLSFAGMCACLLSSSVKYRSTLSPLAQAVAAIE